MTIERYVHRCIVQSGPTEGNKLAVDVSGYDIEYGNECDNCGEVLCTPAQAIAHIYEELTTQ